MGIYKNEKTREISFPIGGIGTGSIGLSGEGRFIDWEIANAPNKGSTNGCSHIAVKAKKDGKIVDVRILNSDIRKDYMGQFDKKNSFSGYGYGPGTGTMAGFPHFKEASFKGEFPIAKIDFSDKHFPGKASLTAFNPFIPLNDKDSSIPAAFFEIEFENTDSSQIEYTIAFSVNNPFMNSTVNKEKDKKICFCQTEHDEASVKFGNLCLATDAEDANVQANWYRGGWFDAISTFWNNFAKNELDCLPKRDYTEPGVFDTGTVEARLTLNPGEKKKARFVLSWYYPNRYNDWNKYMVDGEEKVVIWKNYYATVWESSEAIADYCLKNWDEFSDETIAFKNALFASTIPDEAIDAVSANLSVLKSPTCLRLEDGSFYGWEGVMEGVGSCEGSCNHVWNYAYALPFLFPKLERSMRDLDYKYNMWESGRMSFRLQLPIGREHDKFHPCVDGQMGGIIKSYRDWKISGDSEWLKTNWENIKKSLKFAWSEENDYCWDRDKDGVMEGRQHHTLDMELYGPNSWLEGFYLAALKAAAEMAEHFSEYDFKDECLKLYENGQKYMEAELFNGKYYAQRVDLTDKSILEKFGQVEAYWNEEAGEIKYQIENGCEIDQLCGQWHANIVGLGDIFDKKNRKTAIENLYKYNFMETMREYVNPCRNYCLNDEGGAVICEYPEGVKKPAISVPYCEECWTGTEYELACLLIEEGFVSEADKLIKTVRTRQDGEYRNPWNEMECGSNYARSMSSYALLNAYSGFKFDLTKNMIGFNPKINIGNFNCFWSLGSGYGNIIITGDQTKITLISGDITLSDIHLPYLKEVKSVKTDNKEITFKFENGHISIPAATIKNSIIIS